MTANNDLVSRIESVILAGAPDAARRTIGLEVESMFYDEDLQRIPVDPCDRFSARDLLETLEVTPSLVDAGIGYSLEPGGQLEFASAPAESVHELDRQFGMHITALREICRAERIQKTDVSVEPFVEPSKIALIDQDKYRLMDATFAKSGKHGLWMMRNTTSVQVNFNVLSLADAEEMAFLADSIAPLAALLFSHAPFELGLPVGDRNLRYEIWEDTDPSRCGHILELLGAEQPEGIVTRYAQWILGVPAIFTYTAAGECVGYDGTLGDYLLGLADAGELTDDHIKTALHQSFTHVRFKNGLMEIRITDRPPWGFESAPGAFWTGLLSSTLARAHLRDMVKGWDDTDRASLRNAAHTLSMDAPGPGGEPVREVIQAVCGLALDGLDERRRELAIEDERPLLDPFVEAVLTHGPFTVSVQESFRREGKHLPAFIRANLRPAEELDEISLLSGV